MKPWFQPFQNIFPLLSDWFNYSPCFQRAFLWSYKVSDAKVGRLCHLVLWKYFFKESSEHFLPVSYTEKLFLRAWMWPWPFQHLSHRIHSAMPMCISACPWKKKAECDSLPLPLSLQYQASRLSWWPLWRGNQCHCAGVCSRGLHGWVVHAASHSNKERLSVVSDKSQPS